MRAHRHRLVSCRAVRFAYTESSPPTSAGTLRKFVVGIWAARADLRTLLDLAHRLPGEFVRDVLNAVSDGEGKPGSLDRDRTPTQKPTTNVTEPSWKATPPALAFRPEITLPNQRCVIGDGQANLEVEHTHVRPAPAKKYPAPTASEIGLL
ncbi:hypothetical protein BJY00DRAFT_297104, partial [Aspergillus carlsbadensis]